MHILLFSAGLCLGSLGGFLLALLVLHGRAQSLAEEMVTSQRKTNTTRESAWDRQEEWTYARSSAAVNSPAK